MKLIQLVAPMSLLLGSLCFANATGPVAPQDCWKESGMEVMDGQFLVSINAESMTVSELFTLLNEVKYNSGVAPVDFPLLFDGTHPSMIILVEALHNTTPAPSRKDRISQANAAVRVLQQRSDVIVECNGTGNHANPAGSSSN